MKILILNTFTRRRGVIYNKVANSLYQCFKYNTYMYTENSQRFSSLVATYLSFLVRD